MHFETMKIGIRRTQVVVGNTKVEEGAGIPFDLDAAFVEFLGTLDVPFLELLGALLKASHGLDFCRVESRGVRSCGSSPTLMIIVYSAQARIMTGRLTSRDIIA